MSKINFDTYEGYNELNIIKNGSLYLSKYYGPIDDMIEFGSGVLTGGFVFGIVSIVVSLVPASLSFPVGIAGFLIAGISGGVGIKLAEEYIVTRKMLKRLKKDYSYVDTETDELDLLKRMNELDSINQKAQEQNLQIEKTDKYVYEEDGKQITIREQIEYLEQEREFLTSVIVEKDGKQGVVVKSKTRQNNVVKFERK